MRTLVDIPDEDIQWLDRQAAEQGKSRAALVREAVARFLAGESVRGSVRRRFGSSTFAAGLSTRAPSSTWCRKKERTAASRRATVVGASPSARSCAT